MFTTKERRNNLEILSRYVEKDKVRNSVGKTRQEERNQACKVKILGAQSLRKYCILLCTTEEINPRDKIP